MLEMLKNKFRHFKFLGFCDLKIKKKVFFQKILMLDFFNLKFISNHQKNKFKK